MLGVQTPLRQYVPIVTPGMTKTTYIDSNIFIAALNTELITAKVVALLEASVVERDLVSSVIAYGEVLYTPSLEAAERFLNQAPVKFIDVDFEVMVLAARIRREHTRLKLPDAIHIATAMHAGCTDLISQDKKLVEVASSYLKAYSL